MTAPEVNRQPPRPVRRQSELDAVFDAGEIPIIIGHGLFVLTGESVAHARAGLIDVCDQACVFAHDAALVRAGDWSIAWLQDQVRADAYDHAVVVAGGHSCVRAAGWSQVFAHELARITVLDLAEVWAHAGVAVVCAGPGATIHAARPRELVLSTGQRR